MAISYRIRVDKRIHAALHGELQPLSMQVRAILQHLVLFPEKGSQQLAPGAYRVIANHLKVLYTLDHSNKAVTVYWLGKTM